MIGLIISNIILLLIISGVSYYVFTSQNRLLDEIKNLRNYYSSSLNSVYGELSGTLAETEYDLYEKIVEQERAYYNQLFKQTNDLNFAFSNHASGISSSVSSIQQTQKTLQEKIDTAASQQSSLSSTMQSQQEMITKAMLSQQEMMTQAIQSQEDMVAQAMQAQQELITEALLSQQEMQLQLMAQNMSPQQEMVFAEQVQPEQVQPEQEYLIQQELPLVQADDIVKRANLMAIAYYNALRDKVPNEVFQWDKINKHLYIVGFTTSLYKQGTLQVPVFSEIMYMPFKGQYKVSDVVNFLIFYFGYFMPPTLNPDGLKIFELEKQMNNGETMQSLRTTFGALSPDANFFPPSEESNAGISYGSKYLYDIQTENTSARQLLDEAIKSVV